MVEVLAGSTGTGVERIRGSHRQLQHPWKPGTVTVAGRPALDVPAGTLKSVLKQARLVKREGSS